VGKGGAGNASKGGGGGGGQKCYLKTTMDPFGGFSNLGLIVYRHVLEHLTGKAESSFDAKSSSYEC